MMDDEGQLANLRSEETREEAARRIKGDERMTGAAAATFSP